MSQKKKRCAVTRALIDVQSAVGHSTPTQHSDSCQRMVRAALSLRDVGRGLFRSALTGLSASVTTDRTLLVPLSAVKR